MKSSYLNKIKYYWDSYYNKNTTTKKNSNFSKFVLRKLRKNKSLIDVGCGNGRDSFFFSKRKIKTLGIDISKSVIKKNNLIVNKRRMKHLNFKRINIASNKLINQKFDYIYVRFFLHAVTHKTENKLLLFIKNIKKRNTLVFFEFRNEKDSIFKKGKNVGKNLFLFGNNHFRRKIITKKFIKTFLKQTKSKLVYKMESKTFSITRDDKPNLTRLIFKFI